MKKVIILVVVLVVLVGGGIGVYAWATRGKNAADTQPAQSAEVVRGDVRTTVDATGNVVSNRDVDIKCKASGEVLMLPYQVSDVVRKGDVLMEVDPVYAQRSYDQATAAYTSAQANVAVAKQNLDIAKQDLKTAQLRAQAALMSATASDHDAQAKYSRVQDLFKRALASQEDLDTAAAQAALSAANVKSAEAQNEDLKSQDMQIVVRAENIKLAEASLANAKIQVDTAQQSLDDTKVIAPINGVVSALNIQIGAIVSSGITNIGGGTATMTLSDMSHVYVMASVDESLIGQLITAGSRDALQQMMKSGVRRGRGAGGGPGAWAGRGGNAGANGGNGSGQRTGGGAWSRPAATLPGAEPGASAVAATHRAGNAGSAETAPASGADSSAGSSTQGATPLAGFDFTPTPLDVDITADAYPGVSFAGKVVQIATSGVNSSNVVTFQVKIEVTSANRVLLRPQMTANVKIITEDHKDVLKVPATAIQRKPGAGPYVIVMNGENREDRPVTLGLTDNDSYEIVSGVKEGETVELKKSDLASAWAGAARGGGGFRGPR